MHLILASGSPYRRALIARLGFACEAVAPPYEEIRPKRGLAAAALVVENALGKARSLATQAPPDTPTVVIGSDQVAVCDGEILLKPGTESRARAQLARLSGREHELLTAVALVSAGLENPPAGEPAWEAHRLVCSRLRMRRLSAEEIAAYVARERPVDCAGAYKSEGLGIALFESLGGDDPTAIVGLPLVALCELLREVGLDPLLGTPAGPAAPAREPEAER